MAAEAVMRKSSVSISLIFHVMAFLIGVISFPWLKKDYEIPQPVSVEIVAIDKVARTTKQAPVPVKKQEKKVEEPTPPKPPPPAQNTGNEAVEPVKKDEIKKEDQVKKEDKVLIDPMAHPDKKLDKKEEKKKKVTEEPKKDFASVLKNLSDEKVKMPPMPKTEDMKLDDSTPKEGQNIPLGDRMTMTEMDALRAQLQGCWNVPIGAKDIETMKVDIFMVINRDRKLQSAKVVDTGRYNSDTFFRAVADSAMRAVRNPNCSPFELPPDKYDTWYNTTVTFDPSQMF
ncbi:MAG TPA: hypothetical protein VEF76_02870 [Patescibacteria group bacterium]|nr:hypothetical protein [Patescibacteria group bacterium]